MDTPVADSYAPRFAERGHVPGVIRKILVIVDPMAREQPGIEKAARIARSCGSSLELYICDVEQDVPESWAGVSRTDEYRALVQQRHLADLKRLAEPLQAEGLAVSTVAEWHAPLEQGIGHHVIRSAPDLVIKETHWHPAMPRVSLTRTDWNLIRQVPAPLLLVRRTPWPQRPLVAVSIDPCHPADRPAALDEALIETGRSLASTLAGDVELLHVLGTPPHLPGDTVSTADKALAHQHARDCVGKLVSKHEVYARFAEGSASAGILKLVKETQPAVLVIGAVARPRWIHSAASGTAAQILEQIGCDMLIVKPPGFISPLLVTDD